MGGKNKTTGANGTAFEKTLFEIKQESSKVSNVLLETQTKLSSILSSNSSIVNSQQFLANGFEDFQKVLNGFKQELADLKVENATLKQQVGVLQSNYQSALASINKISRESISRNAVVLGLPVEKGEDLKQLVLKIGTTIGCDIPERSILEAKRLPTSESTNPPPVLATFSTEKMKDYVLDKKRDHGMLLSSALGTFSTPPRRITIRNDLTPMEMQLLRKVQEMKEKLNIKYVWPGRQGKVLLRRCDGAKVEHISNLEQFEALRVKESSRRSC